jgi:PAS domain-containing protein
MVSKEIEVILTRHLASALAMPIFIVDTSGNLVFYNEPAESILGRRFEETGEVTYTEWTTAFSPADEYGQPIPYSELPLVIALEQKHPAQRSFWIHGLDKVSRHIAVTAFPLIGQEKRFLGAVAIFWELKVT